MNQRTIKNTQSAAGHTAWAAEILFDRELRKLSPEQRQALYTNGLLFSELPPTFYVILKVAMEAWNTQNSVVLDRAGRLRVQQADDGRKFYTAQTDVTLITTMLIPGE